MFRRQLVRLAAYATALATIGLLIWAWESIDDNTAIYASRPSAVAVDIVQWFSNPVLLNNVAITLSEAAVGLLIGVTIAVLVAVALSASRLAAETASPFIAVANAIPKLALAPLFVLILGIGFQAKVTFVAVSVFFVPFYALFLALRTIDPTIRAHVRVLGAGRGRMASDLYVPAVVGAMTASLRTSIAFAIIATVIAELISATAGVGFVISSASATGQPARVISAVVVLGIIGFVLDRLLLIVEGRYSRWRISAERGTP